MFIWRKSKRFLVASVAVLSLFYVISDLRKNNEPEDSARDLEGGKRTLSKRKSPDIHVVVGYYQGNDLPWIKKENLTEEIINENGYSPDPKAGQNGDSVVIPSFEGPKMTKLFQINRFNLLASDKIPVNRTLPDVRRKECQKKVYEVGELHGANTSIIIVYHNEAWSTLMRTVYSVVLRSPKNLLHEIILVDDASQRKFLEKSYLMKDLKNFDLPIKIVRSERRIGLVRARLMGAKEATGRILTFLDAHCECTKGWLEPLVDRIIADHKAIVSPVIDIINDQTFQYVRSFELHQGGFNWELHFRWFSLPQTAIKKRWKDPTQPFVTPVMAGGLFSIDRIFFYDLGAYDDEMDIWGGENIEISFRAWMCGAKLEIVPCSHVGHLFRKSSPYSFPGGVGDVLNKNLARVAVVWMDEWKDFLFKINPEIARNAPSRESVSSRISLRNSLQCKSFKWYLENIWPHNFWPSKEKFFGKIRNQRSLKCIQSPRNKNYGQPYGTGVVTECILELYASQLFSYSNGFIMSDDMVCLDPPEVKAKSDVFIMACNGMPRQKWIYKNAHLIHSLKTNLCLDLSKDGGRLILSECSSKKSQKWNLEPVQWTNA